jgi:2,4-dienoyl-CoA reductase-like NADH-dependent reductase (Old Yellow Enzyme family)/thioredoxin reductase
MVNLTDYDPLMTKTLCRLTHHVSRHGAVMSAELNHAGLYANVTRANGLPVYGAADGVTAAGVPYYEMPEARIYETIERFARAAAYARRCGFGMITLHGGHGWLLSQFMSSKVNTRSDKWGGTLENRMRFPLAVCGAIRRAVGPGFPIEIRISGDEVTPRGYDLDEGIAIAKALDGHVDLIHVSAGHHEHSEVFCVTHPSIFAADSENIRFAAAVKKHVKTPVASVGAHCDPELLDELIVSGQADVLELARALMADPDLPKKARAGDTDAIRPCLRCLSCFSGLLSTGQIYCAVNPEIGNEREYSSAPPAARSKRVAIIGGGIAGAQAAITASLRGHAVTLFEKSDRPGGALKCEENVPFKGKIRNYLAYQAALLHSLPIDLRFNSPASSEALLTLAPDVIIAAVGAAPIRPGIPGIDGANVFSAEEAYADPARAGKSVVILGGGLVGVELGIHLARLGRSVTIAELAPALNHGGNMLHQTALDVELAKCGVAVRLSARATEISPRGIVLESESGEELIPADTVIYAAGQAPRRADEFAAIAPEFYEIGDCVSPRNITHATAMADAVARRI